MTGDPHDSGDTHDPGEQPGQCGKKCDARANLGGRERLTRLADFLFEAGMLRKTPRTGYQFLGSGSENVAEHSFRTAVVGFVLAEMAGADAERTAMLCLFHDLHEARTGDFNYVNHMYNSSRRTDALHDALAGTGLTKRVLAFWHELEEVDTPEARLAQDADQLDLILNLKEELDLGNAYAGKWLESALERLRTEEGKALGARIVKTDHTDWWFKGPDASWWENKNGKRRKTPAADGSAGDTKKE
ncbi:metal dependent phosphohydrolase [Desulfovibrio sp. X2]|uniref:HD domain-containing protein n=1 Tax=Desulfovibrio sp. X2 TaxID=941449 RepID=UPI0003586DEC|nr:HD domain-containing protein [Desulfovibrio sp. X2]EPR43527.1 metal dependent phosphohydrolase [Desulfovibrio sp. X2]